MRTKRIHNEENSLKIGESPIDEKMKDSHLRCLDMCREKRLMDL